MDVAPPAPDDLRTRQASLRRAIGLLGVALPIVLPVGKVVFFEPGLPGSISAYYYTDMRNVLVGAMCAIGVYLLYYPGYDRVDNVSASIAGAAAIILSLSPTAPPEPAVPTTAERVIGVVHLTSAAIFFLALAFLSYFRFTMTAGNPTQRKLQRNRLYRACGIIIVASIALAVLADNLLPRPTVDALHPVFWFQAVAILAFGVSWLVKGEIALKD